MTSPGSWLVAIFGDIGAHRAAFADQLSGLGCDPATGYIPPNLHIAQVGDLVHRGPDSDGTLRMADRFMAASPGRWHQLFGNHEGHELGGPRLGGFDGQVGPEGQAILADWWKNRRAAMAVAFDTVEHGPMLVTHAGLTRAMWRTIGSPRSAHDAADLLNRTVGVAPELAFKPGNMLAGPDGRSYDEPGVAWTEAATELLYPWALYGSAPFGQVHGHSSMYRWRDARPQRWTPPLIAASVTRISPERRHVWVEAGGQTFIGCDPGHGTYPARSWGPLVLELAP